MIEPIVLGDAGGRKWLLRDSYGRLWRLSAPSTKLSRGVSHVSREAAALEDLVHDALAPWGTANAETLLVLLDICATLTGRDVARDHLYRRPGEVGWMDRLEEVRRVLLDAAVTGWLICESATPRQDPIFEEPADTARDPVAPEVESRTWFELRVVDEVGVPVDGLELAFRFRGSRRVVQTDASGVARLDDVDASTASARLASLAAVREALAPRWRSPRTPSAPSGENIVAWTLDELGELTLENEVTTTLVLQPRFRCTAVSGVHFEFGRSFVRSSALEQLSQIAEVLRGYDGRKGMIFGHSDRAGDESVNKELSERRAKAIHALLTHDADVWESLFSGSADGKHWHEKWDLEEAQHMLNALGVTDDDGNALRENGIRDKATKQAIHRFQSGSYPDKPAEQQPLAESDHLGKDGRRELFLAYAKRITRQKVEPERLGKIGGASFMGCGEYNPLSTSARDAESRRAVVFLYDPASEPTALPCRLRSIAPCKANLRKAEPEPGKPPYRCAVYQEIAKTCPCQEGPDLTHDVVVRFLTVTEKEADELPHRFVLESDDGTIVREQLLAKDARATDDGFIELHFTNLPKIHRYRLRCDRIDGPYSVFEMTSYDRIDLLSSDPVPSQMEAVLAVAAVIDAPPPPVPYDG